MIDVPVKVKEALREGNLKKNYRFVVYDGDTVDFTIENDRLVAESVTFDERMSSSTELKFGLCEGTSLEFQAFNIPNITGRRLQAFVDVQYNDGGALAWHAIPMGWYDVKETSRQASTGIMKIKAYNKLLSDYLSTKVNDEVVGIVENGEDGNSDVSLYAILEHLLDGVHIETYKPIEREVVPAGFNTFETTAYRLYYSDGMRANLLNVKWFSATWIIDKADYVEYLIYKFSSAYKKYIDSFLTDVLSPMVGRYYLKINNTGRVADDYIYIDDMIAQGQRPARAETYQDGQFATTNRLFGALNAAQYDGLIADLSNDPYVSDPYRGNGPEFQFVYLIPYLAEEKSSVDNTPDLEKWAEVINDIGEEAIEIDGFIETVQFIDIPQMDRILFTVEDAQQLPDVTIRDLQSSVYETVCQYGKLDRTTDLFSGVELNHNRLLPANDLYPSDDLYPASVAERANKAMYSKLWADEGNVRSFRYLIITYKGTIINPDTQEETIGEKRLQRTVNNDGTDDYNLSDNWLFKNLVWSDEDIADYADAMVEKMQSLTWFPFEMWCAGLPYIETGDEVEINMDGGAYTSYVLRRTLKGIQNLQDEMINGTLDVF